MRHNNFQKVKKTTKRMYGPEKLLVCGYKASEHEDFLRFLSKLGLGSVEVVFVTDGDGDVLLKELLKRKGGYGFGKDSKLKRALIMSGFTQENLHHLISAYRKAGLPTQLWATLTPTSEQWSIGFLLQELEKEAEAMKRLAKK